MINYRKLPSDKLFSIHSDMNNRLSYYIKQSEGTYRPSMWMRKINLLMNARRKYAHKPVA